ncbi:MAG: ankyrin repeat domain-containing protein [Armatimonadetes bacterium]|nr:ankyrin repeat domain-containing protein [Armatimonadota bacterium]
MNAPRFKRLWKLLLLLLAGSLYWIYRQTAVDTALVEAARYGDTAAAARQLAKGADIHTTLPPELRQALHYRCRHLIRRRQAPPGRTPLAWAVTGNSPRMVRFLLSRGADPSGQCDYEFVPLAAAASLSDIAIVKALLDYGADANAIRGRSYPPLLNAVSSGRLDAIRLLLKRGADAHVLREGGNALQFAGRCRDRTRRLST